MRIPIEVSGRHIHLAQKDLDRLFGRGYKLKKLKNLSQPREFAAEETVQLITKQGALVLRVLGPLRQKTQIELSKTDCINLDIRAPLRLSGDLKGAGEAQVIGPLGTVKLKAVIIAKRHIHLDKITAQKWKIKDRDKVAVEVKGKRGLIFKDVIVRVDSKYRLAMHIDTDEANAAGIDKQGRGEIIVNSFQTRAGEIKSVFLK